MFHGAYARAARLSKASIPKIRYVFLGTNDDASPRRRVSLSLPPRALGAMGAGLREPMWGFGNLGAAVAWLAALLWSELSAAFARPRRAPDDRVPEWLLDGASSDRKPPTPRSASSSPLEGALADPPPPAPPRSSDSGGFAAASPARARASAARSPLASRVGARPCTSSAARSPRRAAFATRFSSSAPAPASCPTEDLARLRDIRAFSAALGDDGTERKAPDENAAAGPRPRPRLLVHCAGEEARWRRATRRGTTKTKRRRRRRRRGPRRGRRVGPGARRRRQRARAPQRRAHGDALSRERAREARARGLRRVVHPQGRGPGGSGQRCSNAISKRRCRLGASSSSATRGRALSGGGGSSSLSPRRRRRVSPREPTTMSPAASYACSKAAVTAYALGRTAAGECDCVVWDPGLVDTDIGAIGRGRSAGSTSASPSASGSWSPPPPSPTPRGRPPRRSTRAR